MVTLAFSSHHRSAFTEPRSWLSCSYCLCRLKNVPLESTGFHDAVHIVTIWIRWIWNAMFQITTSSKCVTLELLVLSGKSIDYWIICNQTPQRLGAKWRAFLCFLICKSWTYVSHKLLCLNTALITDQSVAINHHTSLWRKMINITAKWGFDW